MTGLNYSEIKIGQKAELKRTITEEDIVKFADVSGDRNPLHLDESYASSTFFKGRVAHGMLSAAFISAVLANKLPGPGSIFLRQELDFKRPVRIGDTLNITVEVIEKKDEKEHIILKTTCVNQRNELTVSGIATVMPMRM
ncbi:MAG: MaoC family dehydratase [Promethearchaeota archaeon]